MSSDSDVTCYCITSALVGFGIFLLFEALFGIDIGNPPQLGDPNYEFVWLSIGIAFILTAIIMVIIPFIVKKNIKNKKILTCPRCFEVVDKKQGLCPICKKQL